MSAQDALARRWLTGTLVATLAFRAWLSVVVPFTGDEAYFLVWGQQPDIGYYDHPPMVGWLLALLAPLSTAEWVLRLPALLLPVALAFGTRFTLSRWFGRGPAEADLAAVLVLLVPMNVWNVLITTDTPLILFSFGAIVLFARAADRDSTAVYLLAGLCLGFAFLSKYFAVLLGLGMIACAATGKRGGWRGVGLVVVAALPSGLLNLYWNLEACWSNVMFNAINRHEGSGFGWTNPALFVAAMREWKRSFEGSPQKSFAGLQMRIEKVMQVTIAREVERLERRLLVLATVGSAGPFVGLFGTVWGIMTSFQSIAASKNTSLAVVAPGIAEALFATAIGLVAAIPATIFYNKFAGEVNKQAQRMEGFADEFAAILSRQIDERG